MYINNKDEIKINSRETLVSAICKIHNIESEILVKYLEIYDDYPYVTFSDSNFQDYDVVMERLKNISRSFKIKKITKRNCAE